MHKQYGCDLANLMRLQARKNTGNAGRKKSYLSPFFLPFKDHKKAVTSSTQKAEGLKLKTSITVYCIS